MSLVAVVTGDLMTLTRIAGIIHRLGHETYRADHPAAVTLGESADVVAILVSWDERETGWVDALRERAAHGQRGDEMPQVVLFGSHRDLDGHREARGAGLGRVVARSTLQTELQRRLGGRDALTARGAPPARR